MIWPMNMASDALFTNARDKRGKEDPKPEPVKEEADPVKEEVEKPPVPDVDLSQLEDAVTG